MTTTPPTDTAVARVSRGDLDPSRFAEVQEMTVATSRYLVPAMIVDARSDAEKAGLVFIPIDNYPVDWSIR